MAKGRCAKVAEVKGIPPGEGFNPGLILDGTAACKYFREPPPKPALPPPEVYWPPNVLALTRPGAERRR
ncbi:hypothetical protein [Arenibaculum sp.]|uniref:hypothetical protein n=1 Tax=Arenibaculum sp. TaxID=2865862 RepID=UPI002E12F94F|nr:hypothetical protein [Arenibaculum sp.]